MPRGRAIIGLDIGSTKIATVVGEYDPARGIQWRAINVQKTEAISRGSIRDLNQAVIDIDTSLSSAIYSSGLSTENVLVGITGRDIEGSNYSAEYVVSHPDGEIEKDDVMRVLSAARPTEVPRGRVVVQTLVRQFYLDGQRISRSPEGMIGRRIEVETHVVMGNEGQIRNIERALDKVQLKPQAFIHSLVASSECVLTDEEKQSGCVLIDFGGGVTSIGIFINGALHFSECIPIGGNNYDQDLKQGLGVSFEEAQRIKKSYGKAWLEADGEDLDEFIDVKFYGRREYDKAKRRKVYDIMQPRTDELVELINRSLGSSGLLGRVAGGIVVVGGACQLRQLPRFLSRQTGRMVRLGMPTGIQHVPDEYRSPALAPVLGLLKYGAMHEDELGDAGPGFATEVWDSIQDMLRRLFRRTPAEERS